MCSVFFFAVPSYFINRGNQTLLIITNKYTYHCFTFMWSAAVAAAASAASDDDDEIT